MVRTFIDQGLSYRVAAALFHVDPKTVGLWKFLCVGRSTEIKSRG